MVSIMGDEAIKEPEAPVKSARFEALLDKLIAVQGGATMDVK